MLYFSIIIYKGEYDISKANSASPLRIGMEDAEAGNSRLRLSIILNYFVN